MDIERLRQHHPDLEGNDHSGYYLPPSDSRTEGETYTLNRQLREHHEAERRRAAAQKDVPELLRAQNDLLTEILSELQGITRYLTWRPADETDAE